MLELWFKKLSIVIETPNPTFFFKEKKKISTYFRGKNDCTVNLV